MIVPKCHAGATSSSKVVTVVLVGTAGGGSTHWQATVQYLQLNLKLKLNLKFAQQTTRASGSSIQRVTDSPASASASVLYQARGHSQPELAGPLVLPLPA